MKPGVRDSAGFEVRIPIFLILHTQTDGEEAQRSPGRGVRSRKRGRSTAEGKERRKE